MADRDGLTVGALPAGYRHIGRAAGMFRRSLEEAVFRVRGRLTPADNALITSAARWEVFALKVNRWLRAEGDTLPFPERLKAAASLCRASDARDRAVLKLGIGPDQRPRSLLSSLDGWGDEDEPPADEAPAPPVVNPVLHTPRWED